MRLFFTLFQLKLLYHLKITKFLSV